MATKKPRTHSTGTARWAARPAATPPTIGSGCRGRRGAPGRGGGMWVCVIVPPSSQAGACATMRTDPEPTLSRAPVRGRRQSGLSPMVRPAPRTRVEPWTTPAPPQHPDQPSSPRRRSGPRVDRDRCQGPRPAAPQRHRPAHRRRLRRPRPAPRRRPDHRPRRPGGRGLLRRRGPARLCRRLDPGARGGHRRPAARARRAQPVDRPRRGRRARAPLRGRRLGRCLLVPVAAGDRRRGRRCGSSTARTGRHGAATATATATAADLRRRRGRERRRRTRPAPRLAYGPVEQPQVGGDYTREPRRPRNPRRRGPILFGFTMAVIFLAEGALGVVDIAGVPSSRAPTPHSPSASSPRCSSSAPSGAGPAA